MCHKSKSVLDERDKYLLPLLLFFFSSRRRHTRCSRDWSSDVCSSDLMLRRPRVLLLDEATSQLDAVNELAVRALIEAVAPTTTVVVIAHRLSTVTSADRDRKSVV